MNGMTNWRSLCLTGILCLFANTLSAATSDRPNVVFIMTDNHGAWTLGCYGNRDIRTPHIDQLAREGTLFTNAFASNPVCSPTRATYLTGLMPSQHGVHCFLVGGRLQVGPDARCTLDRFTSLPEVFRDAGYACGLVGKWHLGDNLRPQEGFDDYWITMPHGGTSTFYDAPIIENGKIRNEPQYLTDFWTKHALRFIDQNATSEKPFFLFLSYNGPYSLGRLLLRDGKNRHAEYYRDKPIDSFPRGKPHPWQYNNLDYQNNPTSIRRVATEVSGVDDGVGAVMSALKKHGIDDNTLVVFVADQGWAGGHGGFFGMGDHTRPVTAQDQMMRVPMIWRMPNRVASGRRADRHVANYDLAKTLLKQVGLDGKTSRTPASPGVDFSSALDPQADAPAFAADEREIFYEFESLRCVRTPSWKYIHRHPNGPHELYDLKNDAAEFNNLAADPKHAEIRRRMKASLDRFFDEYSTPEFDLWRDGTSQTRIFVGVDEETLQREAVAAPEPPKSFRVPEIQVPDGYTVELAAAAPLVTHPTMACLDDRGRLFVCNNAGVNMSAAELEEALPNAIHMLVDRDGDGRYDRSTVFADKMTFPMGGAWFNGALYVASPPNIWRLEDTDDDGVADKREILVDKFGYTGNAASIHGCFFGPDGRLYWCDGYHGHEFRDGEAIQSKREGSYLFSCWPDGTDVRIHCGGGMDNPVEVDFTEEGDVIGTVNILYSRPRVDCQVHWQYGGAYPHRERVLEELQVTGEFLEPMHRFGHVAVSGTMRYRSGALDHRWRDNFFTTFFNSGKVVRLELEPSGSSHRVVQREFLSSSHPDFHPTDVLEDADGSLLVVDTGGWFYRGCPTSQLAKPDVLGAIYRIKRTGMTTLPDPLGLKIAWKTVSDSQRVRLLNDTRHSVRERAVRECAKRGETIIPLLKRTVERGDIRARRNAIWALTRLARNHASAKDVIRNALTDRSASVRQAACHAISQNPDPKALKQLSAMLRDGNASVRRTAAVALGRIGEKRAVAALLKASDQAVDRNEHHAIAYALIEIADTTQLTAALNASSPSAQRTALAALHAVSPESIPANDLCAMLDAPSAAARREAWRVFHRQLLASSKMNDTLRSATRTLLLDWLDQPAKLTQRSEATAGLIALLASDRDVSRRLAKLLSADDTLATMRRVLLDSLASARSLMLHPEMEQAIRQGLRATSAVEAPLWIRVAGAFQSKAFEEDLRRLASDASIAPLVRVEALRTAAGGGARLDSSSFEILINRVHASATDASAAAQILGSAALTDDQKIRLAGTLSKAGSLAIRDLIRPFQRSPKESVAKAFLDGVEEARAFSSLPNHELSDVIKRFPESLRERANRLLSRLEAEHQNRVQRIDRFVGLLKKGDAGRGKRIFALKDRSKCATCHRVGQEGGAIGPDLTNIGANRSPTDLLESILFPSASIVRQYEPYSVVTTDGRVLAGLVIRETAQAIVLQQQVGDPVTIPRERIDEIIPSTVSLMPKGVDESLSPAEIADLVAYLRSLKTTASGGSRAE